MIVYSVKSTIRLYSNMISPEDVKRIIFDLQERILCGVEYYESGGCGIWNITPLSYDHIDKILRVIAEIPETK